MNFVFDNPLMRSFRFRSALLIFVVILFPLLSGCNSEPSIYDVKGKVTLGGKSYKRLIIRFYPVGVKGDHPYYHMYHKVAETDEKGEFSLVESNQIAAGKYKVTFSYISTNSSDEAEGLGDEKTDDDPSVEKVEMVPDEYFDRNSTPVEFEVKSSGENFFEYDVPEKE